MLLLPLFCHNRFYQACYFIKALNFGVVFLQKILNFHVNSDIHVYQGLALFSIIPRFARYLIAREKEIRKRFRFALATDEYFIQTIIMNSSFRERIFLDENGKTSNARLIDRTRPDGKILLIYGEMKKLTIFWSNLDIFALQEGLIHQLRLAL